MAPLDGYLNDPKYSNWVKCGLALNITNEVLGPFVVKEITKLHQSIIKKLPPGVSCGGCRVNTGCPNGICNTIQCEIESQHWYGKPSFTNTCTGRWSTEPWEIAKCYMSPSKGCKSSSAADADLSASINVIINCKHFQAFGTNDPRAMHVTNLSKSKDFRNSVMHARFQRASDNYMKEHLDVLINVLNMVKTPETEADTEEAIHKIEQIKTNQHVLKLEDVIEVRKNATEAIADKTEKDSEQVQRERLLVKFEAGCRKALCKLTEEHINKQEENLSVADFLSRIRFLAVVKNLCSRHQNMLFPVSGTHAHIKEWDMFVYCFILEELELHEEIGNAVFLFVQEVKKIRDKLLLDATGVTQNDLSEVCEYLIDTDLNAKVTDIFNKDSLGVDVIRSNNILVSWWREEEEYGNKQVSKKQLNSYRHILKEIDERLAECKDVLKRMEQTGLRVDLPRAYPAGIGAEGNLKVSGCDKKTETVLQNNITSSNNDDIEQRESLNDFCRKLNVRDVNPEEGSIILNVTCSSITNVLDFWDSCIDGRAVEALSKVRDYYRRYFKCDTLEFDVILTKKGVSRCVNKIVEGLPSHFEELVDKVTHKGHEILKTRDEDLITGSVENLRFDDEGGDDQANLAETPFLDLPWLIDDKREEKEIKQEEQIEENRSRSRFTIYHTRGEAGIHQEKQIKGTVHGSPWLIDDRREEKEIKQEEQIGGYSYLGPTMVMEELHPSSKDPINNPNALTADEIIGFSLGLRRSQWKTFAKDLGYTRNQIDKLFQIYDDSRLHTMLQKWHDVVVDCGENPKHLLAAAFIRIGDIDVAERLLQRRVSLIALEELRPKRKTAERIHRITFLDDPKLIPYHLSQRRRYQLARPYTSSGAGYAYDFPHSDAYITCGERIPGSDKDPTSVDEGSEVWTSSFDHSYLSETIVMGEHHYSSEDPISNPNALTDDEIIECSWELGHSGWETFAKDLGYTRNQIDKLKDTYQFQIYNKRRLHTMLQKWHDVVVGCGENPKHLLAAAFIRIGDIDVAKRLLPRGVSLIALEELRPKRKTAERIHRITFEDDPKLIPYHLSQRRRYQLTRPYTSSGAGYAYDFSHSDAYITCGERIPGSDKDPTSVDEGSEVWTRSFGSFGRDIDMNPSAKDLISKSQQKVPTTSKTEFDIQEAGTLSDGTSV